MDKKAYNHKYYLDNKKRLNAASAAYGKAHPEMEKKRKNIPERRILQRAWQKAHPKRMKELRDRHYGENKEHYAEQFHAWHLKNALKVWARSSIRCHKTRGYEINLTTDQLMDLAGKTERCFYCGAELRYGFKGGNRQHLDAPTVDRIHNGKTIDLENVRIICRLCNVTKGPRTHPEFIDYCKRIAIL
jgi:hypothetical protein